MPHSQSKAQDKDKDKKKTSSSKKQKGEDLDQLDESIGARKCDTPRDTPRSRGSVLSTQDTIAQFFGREGKEKSESRTEDRDSLENVIRSMDEKISKMVTTEHLHKEFEKLITEEVLTSNLEKLRQDLRKNFKEELDKVYERIQELERKSQKAEKSVTSLRNNLSDKETDIEHLRKENESLKKKIEDLDKGLAETKQATKVNEMHVNDIEQYTRRNNIRIYGIDDRDENETAEETTEKVIKFLKESLDIKAQGRDIDIAHRMGSFLEDGNRIIICRFASRMLRNEVIKRRKSLKGSVYVVREDLTNKNAKLLEKASKVSNVSAAWSDQGKVLVLLESGKKMQVTLNMDLTTPLVFKKKQNAKTGVREKRSVAENTSAKTVV